SIKGTKYTDVKGDDATAGISGDDVGLGGVVIDLFQNGGSTPFLTTTTAGDGSYGFSNLGPGSYKVQEELPGGFVQTFGLAGYSFTPLSSGTNATANPTPNSSQGSIKGTKYTDVKGDDGSVGIS